MRSATPDKETQPATADLKSPAGVGCTDLVRPRVGQIWAFGNVDGRRDTIKAIKRGAAGRWKFMKHKLVPEGRSSAVWVKWESGMMTITVKSLLKHWVRVA